jgi:6-pyruvoyltetrahydropterin/6-carboxytetrahydropterin synthase
MLQQIYPAPSHPFEYELHKDMNFAAAHFVPHEGAGACQYMHGHTYFVDVTIAGNKLDAQGFLTNFSAIKKLVHGRYDHETMNDAEEFTTEFGGDSKEFPTTENVARNISEIVQNHLNEEGNMAVCIQVFVRETPTSYIVYRQPYHYETQKLVADGEVYNIETEVFKTGRRVHD